MPRKPILLKYQKLKDDIPLEGCGSHCADCVAKNICKGCCSCEYDNNCHGLTCEQCDVRCWQRKDLQDWVDDVGGLEIDHLKCETPYDYNMPNYIPQLHVSAHRVRHPVYIININKLLRKGASSWAYRKSGGIKKHYSIPAQSKVIITFASKDELLERIWTNSENWHNEQPFWDGLAAYFKDKDINATMNIEFSCFADTPRMEHLINIKRALISAQEFSKRGIPLILDVPLRKEGLEQMTKWGAKNEIKWYMINFQGVNDHHWLKDILKDRLQMIFDAGGKAILCGLGKIDMMRFVMDNYRGKVAITNTTVALRSAYYWQLNDGVWQPHSRLEPRELFLNNLREYCKLCSFDE